MVFSPSSLRVRLMSATSRSKSLVPYSPSGMSRPKRSSWPGSGRQPKSPSQELQLGKLSDQLQCLLAAEGFTDEPVSGCRVSDSSDPDHIARIVQGVVGELKKRGF